GMVPRSTPSFAISKSISQSRYVSTHPSFRVTTPIEIRPSLSDISSPSLTSPIHPTPIMAFGLYFRTILLMNDDPGTEKTLYPIFSRSGSQYPIMHNPQHLHLRPSGVRWAGHFEERRH